MMNLTATIARMESDQSDLLAPDLVLRLESDDLDMMLRFASHLASGLRASEPKTFICVRVAADGHHIKTFRK